MPVQNQLKFIESSQIIKQLRHLNLTSISIEKIGLLFLNFIGATEISLRIEQVDFCIKQILKILNPSLIGGELEVPDTYA